MSDNNYAYCFNNRSLIKHIQYVNNNRIFRLGVIKKLTDTGAALGVQDAMKMLAQKVNATHQIEEQQQVDEGESSANVDSIFDNIPAPHGDVAVAKITGEPGKEITISTPGKVAVTIQASQDLMIHERQPETPYSKMRLQMPVVATPDKESTSTTA